MDQPIVDIEPNIHSGLNLLERSSTRKMTLDLYLGFYLAIKNLPADICENMQLMKDKENHSTPKLDCSICYLREVDVVILLCKHVVACEECTNRIGKCCVCKADIKATMKICVS